MHKSPLPIALVLVTFLCAASAPAQRPKARVSPAPLSAEQLAVYRVVLHGWMEGDVPTINLADKTIQLETEGPISDEGCAKGLEMEPASPSIVHRFRAEDLAHLGSDKIVLVDEDRQSKEVAENDPERGIGRGKSIDDAVRNGFSHGLVTLSEIQFDKAHNHAIVAYGFRCGGLCGNGGTWILEKQDGVWVRKSRCQEWIS